LSSRRASSGVQRGRAFGADRLVKS
jgi:hypothetical protein